MVEASCGLEVTVSLVARRDAVQPNQLSTRAALRFRLH